MDCPFRVGDELVCVDAHEPVVPGYQRWLCALIKDAVYTVAAIGPSPRGTITVRLVEVQNIYGVTGEDYGFRPSRFRKVERRTETRDLTEWLTQPTGDTDGIDRSAPIAPRKRERVQ